MIRRTGAVAAALTALVLLVPAAPAVASTRTFPDRAGDAPAFLDITGLKVFDSRSEVAVKALVPGFDPATTGTDPDRAGDVLTSLVVRLTLRGASRHGFDVVLDAAAPGAPIDRVTLYRSSSDPFSEIRCPGATAAVARGSLKVVLPHSCFGAEHGRGAGDVRAKAILQGNVDGAGRWEGTHTTPWVRRG